MAGMRFPRRYRWVLAVAGAFGLLAALVWALARDGRCEAERQVEKVREGMTFEEVAEILGVDEPETFPPGDFSCSWWGFPDGSRVGVSFDFKSEPEDMGFRRTGPGKVTGKLV